MRPGVGADEGVTLRHRGGASYTLFRMDGTLARLAAAV